MTSLKNSTLGGFGAAADDLGLGGVLGDQVGEETEEQRRRRALLEQMKQAISPFGASNALGLLGGSAATAMRGRSALGLGQRY